MISTDDIKNKHKYSCVCCKKEYTRKSSLDKHLILCNYKIKTKYEKQIDDEEQGDTPSHSELAKIVQELTIKMNKMEEKMIEMEKWVNKKKKKLNVIGWLNTNVKPTTGFLEWINAYFSIKPEHFEILMNYSLFYTIQKVFEYNLTETDNFEYPIKCFSQKAGLFYVGEKKEDNTAEWRKMELPDMILILKTFQNHMIKEMIKWQADNKDQFDNNKISDLYQKAIIKLMSLTFTNDANLSKIKNILFEHLKTEFAIQHDYEFEF